MPIKLLVCDLDNTLYDWVSYFVPSFYAMVDKATDILTCNKETLLDDFREVHQRHHDSEHPFSLLETKTVLRKYPGKSREEVYSELNDAFYAFNSARKRNLILHEGVMETLEAIRAQGITLVAHTDSQLFGTVDRLRRLGLVEYFQKVYCRERPNSEHPNSDRSKTWDDLISELNVQELRMHQLKPDPQVLLEICERENVSPSQTAYVGDSIAKDIYMAKSANVFSIWAKYGAILDSNNYDKLVRITHWTAEDVRNERALKEKAKHVSPDFIAEIRFSEIENVLLN